MAEIVDFPGRDTATDNRQNKRRDLEPSAVAQGVVEYADKLDMLFAVGITKDGKLYGATTSFDLADQILLLERIKRRLLDQFGQDEFAD